MTKKNQSMQRMRCYYKQKCLENGYRLRHRMHRNKPKKWAILYDRNGKQVQTVERFVWDYDASPFQNRDRWMDFVACEPADLMKVVYLDLVQHLE